MRHDLFFRRHPVFTGEELSQYLALSGMGGTRAQEALLAYHRRTGRVVRVRRGLYAVIPVGADPGSYPVDPFLIAAKLTPGAFLSHHTALEFHGRAHSMREYFTYSATRPLEPLTFRSHVYQGTGFPQVLRRVGKVYTGVVTIEHAGVEIRVTSLERTLVDVLNRPDLSGSWEEIWRSLESVEFFDLDKVVEYSLLLANATTVAKVGFFLEQHRNAFMVEEDHLEALHELRPLQPHYLDRARRKSGCLVPKWNLLVPREVLERSWGEVM